MLTTDQYSALLAQHERLIDALPFEHRARNRTFGDFQARLVSERNALLAATQAGQLPPRCILVGTADAIEAGLTLWGLQSLPNVAALACDFEVVAARRDRRSHETGIASSTVHVARCVPSDPLPGWISDDDYLIPYAAGDVLHPALGCTLALQTLDQTSRGTDVWTWNVTGIREDRGCVYPTAFIRKPAGPDLSWLSAPIAGRAFAVCAGALRQLGLDRVDSLLPIRSSSTALALALAHLRWQHHPEYFSLSAASVADQLLGEHETTEEAERSLAALASSLSSGHRFETCPGWQPRSPVPRHQPVETGVGISVIVPFRDKADLTLRTMRSVAEQASSTWVELVLVNNQSSPDELDRVRARADELRVRGLKVRLIDYSHPFNHSRQCNEGARAATGETLVFLNNDATLHTGNALEVFARWSGIPGVATVAAQIVNSSGALQCAGLRARQNPGHDYNSPLEESRDELLSTGLKQVVGNSFACAAIRRSRFFEIGTLDETLFPIGYNDIEFCLRSVARGYRHLMTGWVSVTHTPGSSRGNSDEILQKVLIRERFPETLRLAQFQLESDTQLLKTALAKVAHSIGGESYGPLAKFWNKLSASAGAAAG